MEWFFWTLLQTLPWKTKTAELRVATWDGEVYAVSCNAMENALVGQSSIVIFAAAYDCKVSLFLATWCNGRSYMHFLVTSIQLRS